MIVQPDFLDHWKTNMLVTLLDDPCAPLYVIRLWAHCHNRKTNRFPRGNPSVLKAICHAKQDAELFEKSMCESGFLKIVDGDWIAHDWNVVNAKIMRNWENGKSGGRPKTEGEKPTKKTQTKPTKNPPKTQRKPKRNPAETQTEPAKNPPETQTEPKTENAEFGLTDRVDRVDRVDREERKEERERAACAGGGELADLLHLVQTAREDYTFREQDVVAVLIGAPKKNLRAVIECFVADFANKPEVSTNPLGMLRAYIRNGDQYENGHSKNNGGATDDADDAWRKKLKRGFQQG